jgi:hypothetical protein
MLFCIFVGCGIYLFEVSAKGLSVLPYNLFAAVADLMNDAKLRDSLREDPFDGIRKALQVICACE